MASTAPVSPARVAMRRFARNRVAVIGLGIVVVLLVLTLVAGILPLPDPTIPDEANIDAWPSAQHLLGTDANGHDLLSAMIYGLRPSFTVGLVGTATATLVGVVFGAVAGYAGGWIDAVLGRLTDLAFSIPVLPVVLLCEALFGAPESPIGSALGDEARLIVMAIVFAVFGWPPMMRFVRGLALQRRSMEYVEAARALGGSERHIIARHILSGMEGMIAVQATFLFPTFVYAEIIVSIVGLGVQIPTPDLGYLADQALGQLEVNWIEAVAPSLLLTVLIVAVAFVGDGLRDALDVGHAG